MTKWNAPQGNAHPPHQEIRCTCGSLVAKRVHSGIELKCRRCKRLGLIPLADVEAGAKIFTIQW